MKMKVNCGKFFQALPVLVAASEQIYAEVKAGTEKKATILSLVGIAADDAVKAVPAVLDPHNTTLAQAASAEIDDIVAGYNADGWPGAIVLGAIGATGIVGAAQGK